LELNKGKKEIPVGTIFKNGSKIKDTYSGKTAIVSKGKVIIDSDFDMVLIEKL
jgi:alpha-amylase